MNKKIMTAVMAAMMTVGTMGSTFAAGLGTIDISALLQRQRKPLIKKHRKHWCKNTMPS